jgi:hypothetical protein
LVVQSQPTGVVVVDIYIGIYLPRIIAKQLLHGFDVVVDRIRLQTYPFALLQSLIQQLSFAHGVQDPFVPAFLDVQDEITYLWNRITNTWPGIPHDGTIEVDGINGRSIH